MKTLCAGLVLLTALLGCQYEMVRYQEVLPEARTIAIDSFENRSFEPGVDLVLADALHREFRRRGALRVVDDPVNADLVIEGSVTSIDTISRSFDTVSFALEYEVRMLLDVRIERPDGSVFEIDPRALAETELYLASADVEVARTNREEAIRRLSSALAGRIHDALFERTVQ